MMVPPPPVHNLSDQEDSKAERETITLRVTESRQTLDAVVLDKRADRIYVMLSEGTQSVFCELKPTQSELAYFGNALGREVVYERSRAQVQSDIDRGSLAISDPTPR